MGRGGGVPSGRPPSQAAYFVALAIIALLLLMLCCYFLYFCIKKINELSEHESLCGAPASRAQPTPARDAYPVQPVVRESATAMAKLCKELPSGGRGTVFPAATSPAALLADTGAGAGAGGSLASGSDGGGATLSDDTATTGASEEPAAGARSRKTSSAGQRPPPKSAKVNGPAPPVSSGLPQLYQVISPPTCAFRYVVATRDPFRPYGHPFKLARRQIHEDTASHSSWWRGGFL